MNAYAGLDKVHLPRDSDLLSAKIVWSVDDVTPPPTFATLKLIFRKLLINFFRCDDKYNAAAFCAK